ncbi:hypothetical protein EIP91_003433 [Steccherinum ochraceum]|uniref:NADP-dependent oxidoreductase domain-containing protein n=1 Tax=Steccherinum ochraceum TaxID=92696 RepID=A0A4R0RD20_9APHY|nr:hypothetical protein EIP91_003433 [Steccherinum ochraceum]
MATQKIPYVRLGNSGLKVSRIILGTLQYGDKKWQEWFLDEEQAVEHIKTAYELGIQTFDTANMYSNGLSEIILGNAIKKLNLPREELVIMTKVYFPVHPDHGVNILTAGLSPDDIGLVNQHGLSRKAIFSAVKASLERLQMDYIDVLQCHRFDDGTPIAETMQALHDVVQAGYVRYIGMSSCYAYQFHQMQNYAIAHDLTPFISMQNHYNLIYREEEREMMPTLKMFGVGATPWSPLARGLVTRPWSDKSSHRGETDWFISRYNEAPGTKNVVSRVEEVAKKRGISMTQVSIAWLLSKDYITAPIVGTTKMDNLRDIVAGVHVKLTEEEIKFLEEPYVTCGIIEHQ